MSLKHFFLFFFILLLITVVEFFYLGHPVVGIDDANISMNYAWHFSKGEGFVFNHGGERVEGFTSMLWVLVISGFYQLTSHPELMMMFFLLLLTTLSVSMVYHEVSRDVEQLHPAFFKKYFLPFFCLFLVGIGPTYVAWSILSLMENGLWNFIFTGMVVLILRMIRDRMIQEQERC